MSPLFGWYYDNEEDTKCHKKGIFKWTIYGFIWLIPINIKRIHDPFCNCRWSIELPKTEKKMQKGENQSKNKIKNNKMKKWRKVKKKRLYKENWEDRFSQA